jgi:hypothetical protein
MVRTRVSPALKRFISTLTASSGFLSIAYATIDASSTYIAS